MTDDQKKAAMSALEATIAMAQGRHVDAARHLAEGALELVTPDVARQLINDAAVKRSNEFAVELERKKFGE